jgi:hypothetical protein
LRLGVVRVHDIGMQPHEGSGRDRQREREQRRQWAMTKRLWVVIAALVGALVGLFVSQRF